VNFKSKKTDFTTADMNGCETVAQRWNM